MEKRAQELLKLPDDVLFAHGGCHVFALALRRIFQLQLLSIRNDSGSHDHVACGLGERRILDFFGGFSYSEYLSAETLNDFDIRFLAIDEEKIRKRYTYTCSPGYYVHRDFYIPAEKRARAWITKHYEYFDGTKNMPIPGLSRLKETGNKTDEIRSLWAEHGE